MGSTRSEPTTSSERVAIVTGAGRGIGAAVARALGATGYRVVCVDLATQDSRLDYPMASLAELRSVARECGGLHVAGDVAVSDTMKRAVSNACDRFGRVDVAVAAAGVMAHPGPLWETSDPAWACTFDTNVTGVWRLAQAAVPQMLQNPGQTRGRFVAIGSPIAHKATPRLASYCASKAAVESLIKGLAADLANTGVTANVVSPGCADTAILERSRRAYGLDGPCDLTTNQIDQRLVPLSDIAALVTWICSAEAASINGAVIPIDAGLSAR